LIEVKVLASGSRGNCYRIDDGSTKIILECGIPIKRIKEGLDFKLSEIQGCLISHEHMDHCKAVGDISQAGIDCYLSTGTIKEIADNHRLYLARHVKAGNQFKIGTWTILPFATEHDAAEPLGFLLQNKLGERLVFITDSFYCKYKFTGLTHILLECNYSADILAANVEAGRLPESQKNRLLKSHFSLANVKEFLKANDLSKVQQIILLHLSDGNSDAARFKREIQELTGKPTYIAAGGGGFEAV